MSVITDLIDENSSCNARIAELELEVALRDQALDRHVEYGKELRAELAALKAQGVVMPEPDIKTGHGYPAYSVAAVTELFARLNAAPVQQVSVPDISRLLEALERVATLHIIPPYTTPQSSQLMMLKGIADQALESYRSAATAAPAAYAGHVFYGMDGNHP